MINDNVRYKKLVSDQEYLENGRIWLQAEIDRLKEEYKENYSISKAQDFALEKLHVFDVFEDDIKDMIQKINFYK